MANKYPDEFYPYVQGLTGRLVEIVGRHIPESAEIKDSKHIAMQKEIEKELLNEVHMVEV